MNGRQYYVALAVLAASGLLGGLLGNLLFQGGAARKELHAQSFMLVDAAGEMRGGLSLTDNGEPALLLQGEAGGPRVILAINGGEPMLGLAVAADKPQAICTVRRGNPCLLLQDAAATTRLGLSLHDGEPTIGLADATGRIYWQTP